MTTEKKGPLTTEDMKVHRGVRRDVISKTRPSRYRC
jgi:hypothetical protein